MRMQEENVEAYRRIDPGEYYRGGVFRHFSEDVRCSMSMTVKLDVTQLASFSQETGSRFYLNFLYILCRVLNSREDYRLSYLWEKKELICWDRIHPTQYVFFETTETCTPVYTVYVPDYTQFYAQAAGDIAEARRHPGYHLHMQDHPNWFDASYLPWVSYDAFHLELPDGHLWLNPIVNWGRWRQEGERKMMPVTVRLNHAAADGYQLALVFRLLEREIQAFAAGGEGKEERDDR